MKPETLIEAMTDIKDSYIEDAMPKGYIKKPGFSFASLFSQRMLAAMAVLIFAVFLGIRQFRKPDVAIVTPFVSFETVEEAEKAAGFMIDTPETFRNSTETAVSVYNGNMIEIKYSAGDAGLLSIRKAAGNEDISGDYNRYDNEETITVSDITATIKGDEGLVNCAVWNTDGYSYSLTSASGITVEEAEELITLIH